MQKASEAEGPMLYRCYAGVVEVVMPLFWQNVHVATIFGGSFRDADFVVPDSWDNQRKALYNDLPVWYRSNRRRCRHPGPQNHPPPQPYP